MRLECDGNITHSGLLKQHQQLAYTQYIGLILFGTISQVTFVIICTLVVINYI